MSSARVPGERPQCLRPFVFAALLACLVPTGVMACQPVAPEFWENSPKRVKSNVDHADFVVIARVSDVKKVRVRDPAFSDFTFVVERATFRVEHAFKGTLRAGDTFVIDTGKTACGHGVLRADWMPPTDGKKPRTEYPKRWLIYHMPTPFVPDSPVQPPAFEITVSPHSRPVEHAPYDLEILRKFAGAWARGG